ncbi:hypothetical protein [Halopenitus malekzadehii]|uniref:hypothetical protein n=1 Tax=Halopenitus malekzadehii TaxID=1267564 RepID=UPI00115FF5C8|nr:hypothetical protein [Halopenitus malekzadehii]
MGRRRGQLPPRSVHGRNRRPRQRLARVDTDADGEIDRRFNETHVSGVNTNDYSYTIALDTGYALETDDVIVVEYPAVDTPEESGTYTVAVAINDADPVETDVEIDG